MASMKVFGSIPSANTLMDEPRKRKKKKVKKAKREKSGASREHPVSQYAYGRAQKSKPKGHPRLEDYADICDPSLFAQWPEINKKKRKKKSDVRSNEEFHLTQNKNLKVSKKLEKKRKSVCVLEARGAERDVRSGPGEDQAAAAQPQKDKKRKKRVAFNLSPVVLEARPLQNPVVVRDIFRARCPSADKKPPLTRSFPADGRHGRPAAEENGPESQCTSDDINSQDLFITQKSFSDPYVDLSSSTSAEEAPEPRSYAASSPWQQSRPEHQCQAYRPSRQHKLDASTQTENFFTSPSLATSLGSRHRSACTEEPMDLSLPERSRLHQRDVVSKAPEGQRHPEAAATDLTQSDDSDSHLKSKADLSQLKVVQTRLNESFFFKLKGEADSPKPRSPLMMLTGNGEKKKPC